MSPSADGAINCACGLSSHSGENGGFEDGATPRLVDETCTHCNGSKPSSYSSSTLGSGAIPLTDSDKLRRLVVVSAKGFSIGAGIRGGLALFSILARLRRRKSRKVDSLSDSEAIMVGIKETLRYGLFLGTFSGTFVSVDEIIWRAIIAGLIAGPSMLLTGLNTQHTSLAIYILMRAAVLASRCGIKSKQFGKLCKPLTWEHGDIFLMCLSSSQILSSYLLKPESSAPSYRSFLDKHCGKDRVILQGVKEHASDLPYTNLEAIEKFYKAKGADVKLNPNMKIPCSMIHGNQACSSHVFTFFHDAYKRSLPVYLPVYLIPTLLVHRQGLLKRPYTILGKSLLGTARSSLFLSAYTSSAWMWTCTMNRLFGKCDIPIVALGTFPTGLALAVEKKSRRMEISLYCLARAIESFFTCMADAGYLPKSMYLKRADVVIFSLSTAIIMHCYEQEREVFRSKYLSVLDWVFGVPPPPCESACCKNR
ncbi:TRM112-like protein [Hibiscus syriacus]|uniref:TRM112-like protein n=1 Tax=Hibiscus syriacus TaxID=106335 RepID=A0A6A3C5M7_HIBSY|nr:TRM112-like protein [Hibiscus syriacus]